MSELHTQSGHEPSAEDRLGSWKAIAAYLKRDVTTVQRWERREGMPIHRHVHDKRGSVYAFRSELDDWLKDRRPKMDAEPPPKRARRWIVPLAALLSVVAILAAWHFTSPPPAIRNPLADARISPLTDFEGLEQAAAISRDGKFVAFISDRSGAMDVWVTQIGTGEFHNLTKGDAPELLNSEVRSVGFTPDGSLVTLWTRSANRSNDVNVWAAPTMGGALREYRPGAVELDWTSDGGRLVFHTSAEGDPIFVADSIGSTPRQVHVAPRGVHNHFLTWDPDDKFIYFVRGKPPDEMDVWRMTAGGDDLQRITHHNTRVLYPTFVDERTLLYLATEEDGAGPWLYAMDIEHGEIEHGVSNRISFGVEQYTSLAASADGRRLVATVEHGKASLWRVPITDELAEDSDASRIADATVGAMSPRAGSDFLAYVAAKHDGHSIWRLTDGTATEVWSASGMRVIGGPSIAPDGTSIAFCAEGARGAHLYIADVDGSATRIVSGTLEVRGSPAWSPDGRTITVAVNRGGEPHLFNVSVDTHEASPLNTGYAINPQWSPDGAFLIYADADAGPSFALKGMDATGADYLLPEITLPRGARRVVFVPGRRALIVLEGEMRHNQFWYIDLETGSRRQLSNFGREFTIRDFDISTDGREIIFDRREGNSDLALIELQAAVGSGPTRSPH